MGVSEAPPPGGVVRRVCKQGVALAAQRRATVRIMHYLSCNHKRDSSLTYLLTTADALARSSSLRGLAMNKTLRSREMLKIVVLLAIVGCGVIFLLQERSYRKSWSLDDVRQPSQPQRVSREDFVAFERCKLLKEVYPSLPIAAGASDIDEGSIGGEGTYIPEAAIAKWKGVNCRRFYVVRAAARDQTRAAHVVDDQDDGQDVHISQSSADRPEGDVGEGISSRRAECAQLFEDVPDLIPFESWGSTDADQRAHYAALDCNEFAADVSDRKATVSDRTKDLKSRGFYDSSQGIVDDDATIPAHMHAKPLPVRDILRESPVPSLHDSSRNIIGILISTTTRGLDHQNTTVASLALFSLCLQSLERHAEPGFEYWFYVAYDEGDTFMERSHNEIEKWFEISVRQRLADRGIVSRLVLSGFPNPLKKPGPSFNANAQRAYLDGVHYFYRINDDTVAASKYAKAFKTRLKQLGSPYGVVGPWCPEGNSAILTHDFVHRTHMDIFNTYYPASLSDWWMDDWITRVYGYKRTLRLLNVRVKHAVATYGRRYNVDLSHRSYLYEEVEAGAKAIALHMKREDFDAATVSTFVSDRRMEFKLQTVQ